MYHFEKKRSVVNPLFCLFFPYGLVMLFVSIIDTRKEANLYKMGISVPLLSIFLLLLFYAGVLLTRSFIKHKLVPTNELEKADNPKNNVILNDALTKVQLVLLIVFALLYYSRFGLSISGSDDIKAYFSSGIQGHLVIIISTLFLFIYSYEHRSLLNIFIKIVGIFWLVFSALMVAKYTMFFYAISILLIYFFRKRKKITLFKIILALAFVSLGFFITYIFRFILAGYSISTIPYDFIFNHYIYYFTSGYYGFSYVIENSLTATTNVGPGLIYSGVINIARLITGEPYISSISRAIEIMVSASYRDVNVFTLFGSILLEMDYFHVFLTTFVLSMVGTFFFEKNLYFLYKKNSNKYLPLTCFIMANLIFGFYNCFLGPIFENIIIIIIFTILSGINHAQKPLRRNANEKNILYV